MLVDHSWDGGLWRACTRAWVKHTQTGAGRDKSRDLTSRPACLLRDLANSQPHLPAVFSFPALKDIRFCHFSRTCYNVACEESSQIESGSGHSSCLSWEGCWGHPALRPPYSKAGWMTVQAPDRSTVASSPFTVPLLVALGCLPGHTDTQRLALPHLSCLHLETSGPTHSLYKWLQTG